ncbi:hypothetical protein [Aliiroseovarius sp. 2305UL8-7]|uniref:hypothetical protein n=1 Tax=Aliiroseovarius conchicola TaxID=3121637 RepID=UPI003528189E
MTKNDEIVISHLIPLFRSHRFLEVIAENIEELALPHSEIILADRNGDSAFCNKLRDRIGERKNVRILCDDSNINWVENIRDLINHARGKYLQILPHDDTTPLSSIEALCAALDAAPDAVLAYGRVRAFDLANRPMPERDELNSSEDPTATSWTLDDALPLFWIGRFAGAFKGVIRSAVAQDRRHVFQATPTTIYSERAWLFSLALAGRFVFVPTDMLHKRYYPESTHRSWVVTPEVFQDVADQMVASVQAALTDDEIRAYATRDILTNAKFRVDALRNPDADRFIYEPYQFSEHRRLRERRLGWVAGS